MSKRAPMPPLSTAGGEVVDRFAIWLREQPLHHATVRNYVSDFRHFVAWNEATRAQESDDGNTQEADLAAREEPRAHSFAPERVTTAQLTTYRAHLQTMLELRPASINRALISVRRFFATEVEEGRMQRDPAKQVRLLEVVDPPRRFLSDREEAALVAAVSHHGTPRDRAIVVLLLHTGLRSREVCQLQVQQVHVGKHSGTLDVIGKQGKRHQVPLNATARRALVEYLPMIQSGSAPLFPSTKTGKALTQRALGHLVQRYAALARLPRVRPHDLRHRFGYRMALSTPLHHVAQLMGHESLDTTRVYIRGGKIDLQREVEKIATS